MEITDIRRDNLKRLLEERFSGKQVQLAAAIDRQPGYVSRCLSDGKHRKRIGEDLARKTENLVGLEEGWLDQDHSGGHENGHEKVRSGKAKSAAAEAEALAALATPRSQQALDYITQAAREGRLTEDDLLMLERIAQRIAAQPAKTMGKGHNTKTTRERIAESVTDADNDTQGT